MDPDADPNPAILVSDLARHHQQQQQQKFQVF
jgi:hypothetical protein